MASQLPRPQTDRIADAIVGMGIFQRQKTRFPCHRRNLRVLRDDHDFVEKRFRHRIQRMPDQRLSVKLCGELVCAEPAGVPCGHDQTAELWRLHLWHCVFLPAFSL